MKVTQNRKIYLILLFAWLICSGNTKTEQVLFNTYSWQGTGNMSQSNMTIIWNYINSNFNRSKTNQTLMYSYPDYMGDFATSLSNHLNDQWDKAWNVVIIYLIDLESSDSVVYGYAFRDHWMWSNGYKMTDGKQVTFIIWKDYNCANTWFTYSEFKFSFSPTTYSGAKQDAFTNLVNTKKPVNINDIWVVAKQLAQGMEKDSNFPNSAFTAVASQGFTTLYAARFCALGYYSTQNIGPNYSGCSLLMQMR